MTAPHAALVEALTELLAHFPTDADMAELCWSAHEINAACNAYDKARAAIAQAAEQPASIPLPLTIRLARVAAHLEGTFNTNSRDIADWREDVHDAAAALRKIIAAAEQQTPGERARAHADRICGAAEQPAPVAVPRYGAVWHGGALVCCEEFDRDPCPHNPAARCGACPGGCAPTPGAQESAPAPANGEKTCSD